MRSRISKAVVTMTIAASLAVVSNANATLPSQAQLNAAAQAQVAQAQSHGGQAAVSVLVNKLAQATPTANGGTTPQTYALGLALQRFLSTDPGNTTQTTILPTQAAADPCWYVGNHVYNTFRWYDAGVKVGFVAENHGYWCGNGYSITQNGPGGFYKNNWVQFPYCLNVTGNYSGWDAPHASWAHGKVGGSFGLTTPWATCGTASSGTAALRINANGGWDGYNDWG